MQERNYIIVENQAEEARQLTRLLEKDPGCGTVTVCKTVEELWHNVLVGEIHALVVSSGCLDEDFVNRLRGLKKKPLVVLSDQKEEPFIRQVPVLPAPSIPANGNKGFPPGKRHPEPAADYFFIRDQQKLVRVYYEEVDYIKASRNYLKIYTSARSHIIAGTMNRVEAFLPPQLFVRVHRSYIAALQKISVIDQHKIQVGDQWLPVGASYRKHLYGRIRGVILGGSASAAVMAKENREEVDRDEKIMKPV